MNEKEISEIRRRFRPEKNNIGNVYGCYVNAQGEIVSEFTQSLGLMPEEEAEELLSVLKKTLSGKLGKNLIGVEFATAQVANSEEHRLLMALRNSSLKDENALHAFYQKVSGVLRMEGGYLILLAGENYDVPFRSQDGIQQDDASSEVYSYVVCAICPIKSRKPALSYAANENEFRTQKADWLVGTPELGFLFPAFEDRAANIYSSLYYTRETSGEHQEFADAIFSVPLPMPADEQKETFGAVLTETLESECSLDVMQSIHEQIREKIQEHKEEGNEEPLRLSRRDAQQVMRNCGVSEERAEAFAEKYAESFAGQDGPTPENLVNTKQFQISTPDVVIRVNPDHSDLVETRIINGRKYLLIPADNDVQVNGIRVTVS